MDAFTYGVRTVDEVQLSSPFGEYRFSFGYGPNRLDDEDGQLGIGERTTDDE